MVMILLLCLTATLSKAQPAGRENFDAGWKFHLGDLINAEAPAFPDAGWRTLNLPHDWSIEGSFRPENKSGHQGGLLPGGIGLYRKKFQVQATEGKHFAIVFDGVYKNSTVYLNGHALGTRPYGYATFRYDLTPYIQSGENVLMVRVDNSKQPDSRWYTGAGIYRHVWLITTSLQHITPNGVFVTTPIVSSKEATVKFETTVSNAAKSNANLRLVTTLWGPSNSKMGEFIQKLPLLTGRQVTTTAKLKVKSPVLWDIKQPALYRLVTKVYEGETLKDSLATPFGIRSIAFKADSGFYLNGKMVKILGVCNHHDLGPLGAALNDRALERQLELLKTMGCNGIRCSHNLMAPELLDLCDRMGFLVMDETFDSWYIGKDAAPFGFQNYFREWHERELTDMVLRDRNHPSVILWSIGNEIKEQWFPGSTNGGEIARELCGIIHKLDNTRFTTSAFNFIRDAEKKGMTAAVDVVGFNYTIDAYDEIRQKHPEWFFLASETTSQFDSRGVYHLPIDTLAKTHADGQASAFDNAAGGTTHEEAWRAVKERPWMAGMYIWTGFDYFGEPAPYEKQAVSSYFGIFDLCGFPKDSYYFYKSQWTTAPMVHLLPHWNWQLGKIIDVVAWTNCDEVKLFLNGKVLGKGDVKEKGGLTLRWKVPFESGVLKAVAYRNGKEVATDSVRSAGEATRISLSADRQQINATGNDLSFITVRITDKDGTVLPDADPLIHFTVEGAGKLEGLGNGNPQSLEPAKGSERRAFNGMCLAIVRGSTEKGKIIVKATSPGLPDEVIAIENR